MFVAIGVFALIVVALLAYVRAGQRSHELLAVADDVRLHPGASAVELDGFADRHTELWHLDEYRTGLARSIG